MGHAIQFTNIGTQKIDGTIFETYGIVVAVFSMINQINGVKFFEKTFLIVNISSDVIFEMLFLPLNSANINFLKRKL